MADVFSRNITFGGAFSADSAVITFSGFGAGMIVRQIQYQYQQHLTRVYELSSANVYLVSGRTEGEVTVSRMMGATQIMPAFYTQYGNVCNIGSNHLTFSAQTGCSAANVTARQAINLNYAVIRAVTGQVSSEDMVLNETLNMIFLSLEIE